MKTLGDIQNELSYNDYKSDWNELSLVEQWSLSDEVAKRYALEYGQALLQKVAIEAKVKVKLNHNDNVMYRTYNQRLCNYEVDKDSIINTKLDLI